MARRAPLANSEQERRVEGFERVEQHDGADRKPRETLHKLNNARTLCYEAKKTVADGGDLKTFVNTAMRSTGRRSRRRKPTSPPNAPTPTSLGMPSRKPERGLSPKLLPKCRTAALKCKTREESRIQAVKALAARRWKQFREKKQPQFP